MAAMTPEAEKVWRDLTATIGEERARQALLVLKECDPQAIFPEGRPCDAYFGEDWREAFEHLLDGR